MLNDYIIGFAITFFQIILPCVGVSIAYYIAGRKHLQSRRILKSMHGVVFVLAYGYAVLASQYTSMGDVEYWLVPFYLILTIGGISIVWSLVNYIRPAWHFLLVIEIPVALMIWLAGYLAIIHDSI
jgi:hypothetical protein